VDGCYHSFFVQMLRYPYPKIQVGTDLELFRMTLLKLVPIFVRIPSKPNLLQILLKYWQIFVKSIFIISHNNKIINMITMSYRIPLNISKAQIYCFKMMMLVIAIIVYYTSIHECKYLLKEAIFLPHLLPLIMASLDEVQGSIIIS
jgi:hypothetical protein